MKPEENVIKLPSNLSELSMGENSASSPLPFDQDNNTSHSQYPKLTLKIQVIFVAGAGSRQTKDCQV